MIPAFLSLASFPSTGISRSIHESSMPSFLSSSWLSTAPLLSFTPLPSFFFFFPFSGLIQYLGYCKSRYPENRRSCVISKLWFSLGLSQEVGLLGSHDFWMFSLVCCFLKLLQRSTAPARVCEDSLSPQPSALRILCSPSWWGSFWRVWGDTSLDFWLASLW